MDETTGSVRTPDHHVPYERPPFLTTHRALAACTRELGRLTEALLDRAEALSATLDAPKPVVRRPPGRCIIQLGPVALTVVWLRSTLDSAATGELMVNVWRGSVSPRMHHRSERPGQERAPEPAVSLWERVLTAAAIDEHSWVWEGDAADGAPLDSTTLAQQCIDQLARAYADTLSSPEDS